MSKTTLKDIAEIAGVSVSTVSRILNNDKVRRASEKTARQVRRIAQELNYDPNRHAQNLVARRNVKGLTKRIAYISLFPSSEPFYSQIMDGIESETTNQGYKIGMRCIGKEYNDKDTLWSALNAEGVDGVIVIGTFDNEHALETVKSRTEYAVFVDSQPTALDCDSVSVDYYEGVKNALGYLNRIGHREIGFISGREKQIDGSLEARYAAYRAVLQDLGIGYCENYVSINRNDSWSMSNGYEGALDIIKKNTHLPSSFFIASDRMAIGAIKCFKDHGFKIPSDISVIGFDDMEVTEYMDPPLTTVRVHKEEMGRLSARMLISKMTTQNSVPVHHVLPTELIIRKSC